MRGFPRLVSRAVLALAGVASLAAEAQSSGGAYRIDRVVIAGGGSPMSGGPYQVSGTFGQAATATLAASGYRMFDGFWSPDSLATSDRIFANGFDP
jgi:hypothetical protein